MKIYYCISYQVNNLNITAAPLTVRNAAEKQKRHNLSVNVTRIYESSLMLLTITSQFYVVCGNLQNSDYDIL